MRQKLVPTKSLKRTYGALGELDANKGNSVRPGEVGTSFVPTLALVSGPSGVGKTTAIASALVSFGGVCVRARAIMTVGSLLKAICFELGIDAPRFNNDRLQSIIDVLKTTKTPLFIDEADYLIKDEQTLETLRDIHDEAGATVVLIGMKGIERKLGRYPQFIGRISQHVEFTALDLQDTALMARELCEVEIKDDLVELMHRQTGGNIRQTVIALQRFEKMARINGLGSLDAATWANRPMFLTPGRKGGAAA